MPDLEHKMFFTIPQLMVSIEAVFQQLTGDVKHWDDAPHVIFECWEPEQMFLINEYVLRGRTPQVFMNIDVSTTVPSFAAFLKFDDPDGFNLTEAEINLLYQLSGQYCPSDVRQRRRSERRRIKDFGRRPQSLRTDQLAGRIIHR